MINNFDLGIEKREISLYDLSLIMYTVTKVLILDWSDCGRIVFSGFSSDIPVSFLKSNVCSIDPISREVLAISIKTR